MTVVEELKQDREKGAKRLESEYKAGLVSLAMGFCVDPSDAEELVNRTFAAVIEGIDGFLEQSSFFTWMCRIMSKLHAMDVRRKSNRTVSFTDNLPEVADEAAEAAIYDNLDASFLRDAVGRLPEDQREVIVLHYFMDMPVAKIAKFLAVPSGTVRSRLHYARAALAAKFGAVAKKPGVKALMIALALAALTAAGAATSLAVVRLLSSSSAAQEQQAHNNTTDAAPVAAVRLMPSPQAASQEQQADNGSGAIAAEGSSWLPLVAIDPLFPTPTTPTKETLMNTATRSVALGAAATALALASTAEADLPPLDSSQFDYTYDMIVLPSAQNLDNDGAFDFTLSDSSKFSLGTGVNYGSLVIDTLDGGKFLMSGADAGSAGGAWRNSGISAATGYTVEARLKITSTSGAQAGAIVLNASVDDMVNAWLKFWAGSIWWGETQIHNVDATEYHTYRIVREAGSTTHSVYVDGELVASDLGSGFSYSSPLKRLLVGSPGGTYKGKAQVEFLRFQKGGYAPPTPGAKSAKKWSGEFPLQYEMNANDTRFIGPTASGTDWTGSVDGSATVTQNGVLSVSPPVGKTAYWRANDSIWSARIGSNTAYTLEFKIQIRNKWNLSTVGDRVVQFICGNPRAAAVFYIGPNNVTWEPNGAATYTTIPTGDNTDAMHTFRLTYDGATRHGYTLWRDGEVIGSYLVDSTSYNQYASAGFPNLLRWGVTSSTTVGGSFDVDYVRWTTDGAWDYKDPPEAFVVVVR